MNRSPRAPWSTPSAIPSGTTLRFVLLVIAMSAAVVTEGMFWTGPLLFASGALDGITPGGLRRCVLEVTKSWDGGSSPSLEEAVARCGLPSPAQILMAQVGVLAVFWAVVLVLYWLRPALRVRRRHLRPFPADRRPEQARELTALAKAMGVGDRVTFLVDLLNPRVTGLAFGRRGRRHVMLSRGLLQLYDTDRQTYRAVVLHELAHVRNRDIDITFITDTAWRLFLRGVLLPGVIGFPLAPFVTPSLSGPVPFHLLSALQLVIMGVLVPLARNAVLHSRELHADARAVQAGAARGLTAILERQHEAEEEARRAAPKRRDPPPDILSSHPSAGRRLRALSDPAELSAFGPGVAFGLGVACTLAYEPITDLVGEVAGVSRYGPVALLPVAAVLGGSLCLGVWRAELAGRGLGRSWEDAGRAGRGLGYGLALGTIGSQSYSVSLGSALQIPFAVLVLWWITLVLGGRLAMLWMVRTAHAWAPVVRHGRRPWLPVALTLATGIPLLSVWLSYLLHLAMWEEVLGRLHPGLPPEIRFFVGMIDRAIVFPVAGTEFFNPVLLWVTALVPLCGLTVSRRMTGRPRGRSGPAFAIRCGLAVSGVAGLAILRIHVQSALLLPGLVGWTTIPVGLALAGLVQTVAGVVALHRASELRALHGMLAAATAGAVAPMAVMLSRDQFACIHWGYDNPEFCELVPSATTWHIALYGQYWGLLAAVPIIVFWAGHRAARQGKRRPAGQGHHADDVRR
ncbi:M56 family metallopeptidase [Actinomadura miaoliensis]|uniref:Peptidase M48 domain-containing protein n=1 Tax=Actinomadura miaoliensis TaxID=430685 RepID=A0ABP7W532_9ACTN